MSKNKSLKRLVAGILALTLVVGNATANLGAGWLFDSSETSITAYAEGNTSYVDGSGTTQTVDATELAASTTNWTDGSWYIVPEGGLTISGRIAVNGTVNLILRDGATLTASAGIRTTGATLNIYAQSAGTGALTATGNNGGRQQGGSAGIGGNGVGGYESGGAGGTVNIYGGIVTATGGNGGDYGGGGAGIGGGGLGWRSNSGSGACGTVNIYGGTVTATGGNKSTTSLGDNSDGPGIGGGGNGRDTSTPANGTLTLGKGVKLYNGTDNTGTVLDDSDSAERSYSGSRPKNMFAEESVISGPDKTALNDAITEAETLYNSIKDNTDYADIASTLQTAINTAKGVADNADADQDAVDAAVTAINTAKTTAETAKKDVDDTKASNAVTDLIIALPDAEDVTVENKEKIEEARKAYNDLSVDQKAMVTKEAYERLTNAEAALAAEEKEEADEAAAAAVTDMIEALPAAEDITLADKAFIKAATIAYTELTPAQQALVPKTAYDKLIDDITAYAQAVIDDNAAAEAAAPVIEQINALPESSKVTLDNEKAITDARKAFNDLTPEQKAKVPAETYYKLVDDEIALAAAQKEAEDTKAAKDVSDLIDALPKSEKVTLDDEEKIIEARKEYDALTPDQKVKVSGDTYVKLVEAELALEAAQEKDIEDTAAAKVAIDLIDRKTRRKECNYSRRRRRDQQ